MKMKLIRPLLFLLLCFNHLNAVQTNDETIEKQLQMQIDEERMAHRLYTKMFELHPEIKPFKNIIIAEKRHFSALVDYAQANYPDLKTGHLNSPFLHREVKMHYDEWLKEGKTSNKHAVEVGIKLEKMDIEDIEHFLSLDPEPELAAILEQLKQGSQRHLSAFRRHKTRL